MNQALQAIGSAKESFTGIVEASPETTLVWKSEANFAMQLISKNQYSMTAVANNSNSLRDAVINVASIGLTLNPAMAYAYLVPRDGAICLDIGYQGLIKIATDTGSIMWCRADVVYDKDIFVYKGPAAAPTHTANPFDDRGAVVGVYCIAKTREGDYLVEVMTEKEILDIKSKSPSAKSSYSPWTTFPNEMRKKAVIKRASKTWPKTDKNGRLAQVIEHVNQEEGIDFDHINPEDVKKIDDLLHQKNGAAIANLLDGDASVSSYWARIIKTFAPKGQIGKHTEMVGEWKQAAIEYVQQVADVILDTEDETAINEAFEEMNDDEQVLFWKMLTPESKIDIENKVLPGV